MGRPCSYESTVAPSSLLPSSRIMPTGSKTDTIPASDRTCLMQSLTSRCLACLPTPRRQACAWSPFPSSSAPHEHWPEVATCRPRRKATATWIASSDRRVPSREFGSHVKREADSNVAPERKRAISPGSWIFDSRSLTRREERGLDQNKVWASACPREARIEQRRSTCPELLAWRGPLLLGIWILTTVAKPRMTKVSMGVPCEKLRLFRFHRFLAEALHAPSDCRSRWHTTSCWALRVGPRHSERAPSGLWSTRRCADCITFEGGRAKSKARQERRGDPSGAIVQRLIAERRLDDSDRLLQRLDRLERRAVRTFQVRFPYYPEGTAICSAVKKAGELETSWHLRLFSLKQISEAPCLMRATSAIILVAFQPKVASSRYQMENGAIDSWEVSNRESEK